MVADEAKVEPLIKALEDAGFIVGGTANSISTLSHTQGWLHCDIPGTDASGVVKAMMDELIDDFRNCRMPNRVHITTSCCQINCGGQGDIAINVQHTKPPKINHDLVSNVCERPSVVARCPVAAFARPWSTASRRWKWTRRNASAAAPATRPAADADQRRRAHQNWPSGWVVTIPTPVARPTFQKLVAAGIPNNPPRWPEATAIVKQILKAYREGARDWERVNDWIERIGWPRFFEVTGLPFTKYHVDNWRGARNSLNASTHIRF